jgi:hypothetical protein
MTRIEKTQINASGFIILSSTLKKIQSDNITEIVNEGKGIVHRKKEKHEQDDFSINLDFLQDIFKAMVTGDMAPIVLSGEAESYLRNCSFACYYYRKENERRGEFDHFDLFHNIHFPTSDKANSIENIIQLFCGLFRIDFDACRPFFSKVKEEEKTLVLPPQKVFNEVFTSIKFQNNNDSKQLTFESGLLDMNKSLDSLFATKDLLFANGLNTASIPEHHVFSIEQRDEVKYEFKSTTDLEIKLTFRYDYFKVEFKIKN